MSNPDLPPPPTSEAELMERCRAVAGRSLGQLATQIGVEIPDDLRRAKGWVGQLVEAVLGADAASLAEPDFRTIGVEMKTVPLDFKGRPRESTYVCTVPLEQGIGETWATSWARRKLARVLWVPVEAERDLSLPERRLGTPFLWSPDPGQESILRTDWEELMEMVCLGQLESITARFGRALQIRPKAANARTMAAAIGPEGERILTNPRGFYLRPSFTRAILQQHFG
ncbi:DNA mismatch repair endonuclease MutH [Thiohalomonas denitrificans]|uniref:DNA mismatch repair endonuclease MutH n=1 Tax=Thiohalomonas denitrificans TaxID=415747 RepID=UPI0026EDDF5C|nr:DNA mismatch repair endonuclease MutH [Thiohalomonas denitrificans]